MKNKKIVVTGGAGFIGSNLAISLSKENEVVAIDDLSTGHLENIRDYVDNGRIEFARGSITDLSFLQNKFSDVHYVFHEAALPSVPRSIKDPLTTNNVNITGTLNVLLAARDTGVQKVIYASSSSVYGDTPILPKNEEMVPNPLSPYAVSKLAGEHYCQIFTTVFDLSTVALRYFNVYGFRQDPSSQYAAVIPRFFNRVLHDQSPVIYGDGEQTRDFTFVADVVRANILAAESEVSGVFNIAGGRRISVNTLAKTIIDLCDKEIDIIFKEIRSGDIKHSLADILKAKKAFGYIPEYDIKNGLNEAMQWFKNNI